MANICAIHDLAGVGRCSLVAAISVLSAMGHHCAPLPTAIFSNQTGFPAYSFLDLTGEIPFYLKNWQELSLKFDIVYTGFLGNHLQPELLLGYLSDKGVQDAFLLVDPVMGDEGRLYSFYPPEYVAKMKKLIKRADMITPNMTEFCLLAGSSYQKAGDLSEDEFLALANAIASPRLKYAVITGSVEGGLAINRIISLLDNTITVVSSKHTGISYSGTGDVFSSAVCGFLGRGEDALTAVRKATAFLEKVALATAKDHDPRYGICYEAFLGELAKA